jgi:uncharacterized integral membrane protein
VRLLILVLASLVLLILGSTFAVRNPQQVSIDYYLGLRYQGSLAGLMLLSFGIGAIAASLAFGWRVLRLRRAINKANRVISLGCPEQRLGKLTEIRRK